MRECKPVRYRGIDGAIKVEKKGSHKVFGEVYYHPGVPNLVSVGQLSSPESKAEGVNIDWENGAFEVSKGDESYLFANDGRNLYTADLSEELPEVAHFSVETVEANERLPRRECESTPQPWEPCRELIYWLMCVAAG